MKISDTSLIRNRIICSPGLDLMRWLLTQLDGKERYIPKTVAQKAIRENRVDVIGRRHIVEKRVLQAKDIPSSDPNRFLIRRVSVVPFDPIRRPIFMKPVEPRILLIRYPVKDQRGRIGKSVPQGTALAVSAGRMAEYQVKDVQDYSAEDEVANA